MNKLQSGLSWRTARRGKITKALGWAAYDDRTVSDDNNDNEDRNVIAS